MVLSAKHFLYVATLISLILFEAMVRLISKESDVFVVQFLMGSVLVSIAPPLVAAFIHDARTSSAARQPILCWGIALALTGGILATVVTALRALKLGDEFNAYAWGPIASLLTSATVVAATYLIWAVLGFLGLRRTA